MLKWFLFLFCPLALIADNADRLHHDLKILEDVNKEIKDSLPIIYNSTMMGGYVNMPSARMAKEGMVAIGASYTPPYMIYSLNFQPFSQIEVAGNYRVFLNQKESGFGDQGFGDDADRCGNIKLSFYQP